MKKNNIIAIIITFLTGIYAGVKLDKTKYYLKAKKIAKDLISETAESIYFCELILIYRYNQEEEQTITDFSQYKEKKRVGIIVNKTEPSPQEQEGLDDDIIVYPKAVVYKIGDTWLWKVL